MICFLVVKTNICEFVVNENHEKLFSRNLVNVLERHWMKQLDVSFNK